MCVYIYPNGLLVEPPFRLVITISSAFGKRRFAIIKIGHISISKNHMPVRAQLEKNR